MRYVYCGQQKTLDLESLLFEHCIVKYFVTEPAYGDKGLERASGALQDLLKHR